MVSCDGSVDWLYVMMVCGVGSGVLCKMMEDGWCVV